MDTQFGSLQRCAQVLTRSWLFMKKSTLFLRGIVWVVPYGIGISPLSLAKTHAALLLCEGCSFSCSWRSWRSWRSRSSRSSRITSHKSSVFPSGPTSFRWHRGTGTREWKRKKYEKKKESFSGYTEVTVLTRNNHRETLRDTRRETHRDTHGTQYSKGKVEWTPSHCEEQKVKKNYWKTIFKWTHRQDSNQCPWYSCFA